MMHYITMESHTRYGVSTTCNTAICATAFPVCSKENATAQENLPFVRESPPNSK